METLTFDGSEFSNGDKFNWRIHGYHIYPEYGLEEDDEGILEDMLDIHFDAIMSNENMNFYLSAGRFEQIVVLEAPVRVKDFIEMLGDFYCRPLIEEDYETCFQFYETNKHLYKTYKEFKSRVSIIGHLKGDHKCYSGISKQNGYYYVLWSS
jgi:hypothetical protein